MYSTFLSIFAIKRSKVAGWWMEEGVGSRGDGVCVCVCV